MGSEWLFRSLSEMSVNFDTRRKPVKELDRTPGPYPYYGASGVVDHVDGYLFDGEYLLVAEDGENLRTRNTPFAFRAIGKFWVNNHAHIVQGNESAGTRFLQYALLATDISPYLTGAVMPKLTQGNLNKILLSCPPLTTQDEIVGILGALDDRIDLLRQTNTTLEAIAQTLFKSWFVDFDPVHANVAAQAHQGGARSGQPSKPQTSNLSQPRAAAEANTQREPETAAQDSASDAAYSMPTAPMDAATAALFPSEFEASELGLIPKGWRIDEIGNTVKCLGGGTPSTKEDAYWRDGEFHWVTPKDLSGLQAPVLTTTRRKVTDAGLSRISSGLLPAGTLLLSSRAPIGYLALAGIPTAINQGFIAMPPGGTLPPVYLYFWTQTNMDSIKQKANGSTFMEISKSAFRPIKLCVPPPELVDAFGAIASPLMARIEANEHHRVSLTQLRDTLLPRLISGKLRLPDAEREIEAAP